uniref:Uncharacterized protein n=1 Tax=Rangifer tarandus platyrhynchus TaxID=3082113 RepID=A0ACB0ED31_RANTA|nr:unnamed protein product [Rangifer tarandus platyrhynchus]
MVALLLPRGEASPDPGQRRITGHPRRNLQQARPAGAGWRRRERRPLPCWPGSADSPEGHLHTGLPPPGPARSPALPEAG